MNRRTFLKTVPAISLLALAKPTLAATAAVAGDQPLPAPQDLIPLPPPDLTRPAPLMQALKNRQSSRSYSDKKISLQQLSDLLWAADGTNRADNKRTAPAAMGVYNVEIYAFLPDAVYRFDPKKHQLALIAKGDNRKAAGSQDFVALVPLNLVYVSNPQPAPAAPGRAPAAARAPAPATGTTWAAIEAGCMVQNVYLYCATAGLASVVRALFDAPALATLLKLKPDQILISQTVGIPK